MPLPCGLCGQEANSRTDGTKKLRSRYIITCDNGKCANIVTAHGCKLPEDNIKLAIETWDKTQKEFTERYNYGRSL